MANVVDLFKAPFELPPPGEKLPGEVKEQVMQFLPFLCNKARPETCELYVACDPGFTRAAKLLFKSLCDSEVALAAKSWLQSIVRGPGEIPVVVRNALASQHKHHLLAAVTERRDRLWETSQLHRI